MSAQETPVEAIANAVLYEGYLLYPYRASAVKNQKRWNFGVLSPPGCGGDSSMQTEVLLQSSPSMELNVRLRFLQLVARDESWQEATEREVAVSLTGIPATSRQHAFSFPGGRETGGTVQRRWEPIQGLLAIEVTDLRDGLIRLRARIANTGSCEAVEANRGEVLLRSFVSTHTIFQVRNGEFVSLLDPPGALRDLAGACRNQGTWPVLAGGEGQRDTMLSAPIILYDYPQIAPESPGALFDGTEIDEILTLRILTMTDEEKKEMAEADSRAREILERTESMPAEQFLKMHGAIRGWKPA